MRRAGDAGIGVILDAKRGDIGATAAAYARAYLTPLADGGSGDFEADCLTINPLMGPDTLAPFVECSKRYGKGLFVLCRTSNPCAGWIRDKLTGNRLISDRVADLIGSFSPPNVPVSYRSGDRRHCSSGRSALATSSSTLNHPCTGLGAQGGDVTSIHSLRGSHPEICWCLYHAG